MKRKSLDAFAPYSSFSHFFTPHIYYLGNKLANVAEIIKLIIRDESVHGTYIGYKFQLGFNELPEEEQENSKNGCMTCSIPSKEMKKAIQRASHDGVGWTEEVKTFRSLQCQ